MTRLLLLLAIMIALDLYAFQALRVLAQSWSETLRNGIYGFFWLTTVIGVSFVVAGFFDLSDRWPKGLTTFLRAFVFISYLSKVPMAAILLIDDLRRLVTFGYQTATAEAPVNIGRSRFLSTLAAGLGAIPFATLLYGMVRNPYRYQVFSEILAIDDLPDALDGLRIVQISDIHSGSFTRVEPVRDSVAMINALNPDLVFFTGDIVNNEAHEMEPYVDVFKEVRAKHGVYSVLGNHDYGDYVRWESEDHKRSNMEQLYDVHRRLGWDLLRNENRRLEINGENIAVLGVENWSNLARFPKHGDLAKAYAGTEDAPLKILLSHDPTHWDAEVRQEYQDIHLTLSGHTHGMQFGVEIPGFRWSPAKFVYEQWAGLYRAGKQFLYVNRGLGFLGYPGRVGILPEVTLLTLKASRES
jgi:predicted MPP superfamily phosphohydrolase